MNTLPRTLGLRDVIFLTIGSVIGSGIFLVPGSVVRQVDGFIGPALAVWLVGGVLSLLGAYVLALKRAWVKLRSEKGIDGLWAMTFLVMLFLGNTTESSISQSLLIWTLFVAVACMRWERRSNVWGDRSIVSAPSRTAARARARN